MNAKSNSPNFDKALLKQARSIVQTELRLYDLLTKRSKLRFEKPKPIEDASRTYGPDRGFVCGHKLSLTQPCEACGRSIEDCRVYEVAQEREIRSLLAKLK